MTITKTLLQHIAGFVLARANCLTTGNDVWFNKHTEALEELQRNYLPSGSGIDGGTKIDLDESNREKIVLHTSYHHMNEGGYDGWTDHTITVTPAFDGFDIAISGKDRNDIKAYLGEVFENALSRRLVHDAEGFKPYEV